MASSKQQTLSAPAVPTLPDPGANYSDKTVRASNGLVRTFMQRLTGSLQALFGPAGVQYIDQPYTLIYSTLSQTPAVINTAYSATFNQTFLSNHFTLVSSSRVTASVDGVYSFVFEAHLNSSSSNSKIINFWISRNGVDVAYSNEPTTLVGSGTEDHATWAFMLDLAVDEYIEIRWSADSTDVTMNPHAASSPTPATPACLLSVSYVSPLPAVRPSIS